MKEPPGQPTGQATSILGLLQTVGGTAEPITLTILCVKPRVVVFIASEDTQATVVDVKRTVRERLAEGGVPDFRTVLTDDPASLMACHQAVGEGLHWLRTERGLEQDSIRIDFTGGTKAMSAAAVLAAAPEGYRFLYVSGTRRDKDGVGTVVTGHEELCRTENPWTVLEEPEVRRILDMTTLGQWAAAADSSRLLTRRSTDESRPIFRMLEKVVEGLGRWDRFEHERAWASWQDGLAPGKLVELAAVGRRTPIQGFAEKCRSMIGRLSTLANQKDEAASVKGLDWLVLDMLGNGDRQSSRGNFDEASLRYYRALELCASRRLKFCYSIDNDAVKETEVPVPLRDEFLSRKGNAEPIWKLAQYESVQLLAALGDRLGDRLLDALKNNKLDNQARNENWLIHGTQHVDERRFQAFRKSVLDALDVQEKDIPAWPDFRPALPSTTKGNH